MYTEQIKQFLETLTDAQSQELHKLTTADEVTAFAQRIGTPLSCESAQQLAEEISDEAMTNVTGGMKRRAELELERAERDAKYSFKLL